jgi:hypothetical protein
MQRELQANGQLLNQRSCFEVQIAIGKLKIRKSLGIVQVLAERIHAESSTLRSEIQKLINSIWNKEELPQQWK